LRQPIHKRANGPSAFQRLEDAVPIARLGIGDIDDKIGNLAGQATAHHVAGHQLGLVEIAQRHERCQRAFQQHRIARIRLESGAKILRARCKIICHCRLPAGQIGPKLGLRHCRHRLRAKTGDHASNQCLSSHSHAYLSGLWLDASLSSEVLQICGPVEQQ